MSNMENERGHPRLLAINEAAKQLSISERMLRQLIKDKHIGCVKIGKRLAISLSQLEEFIKAHQH